MNSICGLLSIIGAAGIKSAAHGLKSLALQTALPQILNLLRFSHSFATVGLYVVVSVISLKSGVLKFKNSIRKKP